MVATSPSLSSPAALLLGAVALFPMRRPDPLLRGPVSSPWRGGLAPPPPRDPATDHRTFKLPRRFPSPSGTGSGRGGTVRQWRHWIQPRWHRLAAEGRDPIAVAPCGGGGSPSSRCPLLQDSAAARGGGGCGLVAALSSSCVWRCVVAAAAAAGWWWLWTGGGRGGTRRRRDGGGGGLVGAEPWWSLRRRGD
jgi:hypothetical protein